MLLNKCSSLNVSPSQPRFHSCQKLNILRRIMFIGTLRKRIWTVFPVLHIKTGLINSGRWTVYIIECTCIRGGSCWNLWLVICPFFCHLLFGEVSLSHLHLHPFPSRHSEHKMIRSSKNSELLKYSSVIFCIHRWFQSLSWWLYALYWCVLVRLAVQLIKVVFSNT